MDLLLEIDAASEEMIHGRRRAELAQNHPSG
jgi:hypothetical protein